MLGPTACVADILKGRREEGGGREGREGRGTLSSRAQETRAGEGVKPGFDAHDFLLSRVSLNHAKNKEGTTDLLQQAPELRGLPLPPALRVLR